MLFFLSCLGISSLHFFPLRKLVTFVVLFSAGKDYPVQASTRDEMLVWIKFIDDARVSSELDKMIQWNPA